MAAVTISRQLGSQGDEVAQAVAERLDFRVVCRDVINRAAIRCGAPEMALAVIDDLGLFKIRPSAKARQAFLKSTEKVVKELAEEGNVVIVGRAGQVILRESPDVLHVKVMAPAPLRAERVAAFYGISLQAARAQVEASDRSRQNYLKRYYRARWDDPELYDLIVNTARLRPIEAAALICRALESCLANHDPDIDLEPEANIERFYS
jgi:cytidylate kinase